jgi:hypothetical protein
MYVLTITFRLDGMEPVEFAALNNQVATQYGDTPGLISKIFLADPEDDHAYGGVYLWHTRADAEAYLQGELVAVLLNSPQFADVQSCIYQVLPEPTLITGGPIASLVTAA